MSSHFWWTMATSPFALWVAALLVVFTKPQTPPMGKAGSEVICAKPIQWSIFGLLMAASFVWTAIFVKSWPFLFVSAPGIFLFMFVGEPRELRVNLDQRTYVITSGWPLLRRQWDGPLSDVSRIRIPCSNGTYLLTVCWKQLKRWKRAPGAMTMGEYRSREQVLAAADRLMETWGINVPVGEPGPSGHQQWHHKA